MKLRTKEELLAYALDKGFFGKENTLFACEDGNMWHDEEGCKEHSLKKDMQYFELTKESKKEVSKKEAKEQSEDSKSDSTIDKKGK